MGMFFWRLYTTKTTHNAAIGLNNIVVTNVVGFTCWQWPAQTVETAKEYAGVNRLQAVVV